MRNFVVLAGMGLCMLTYMARAIPQEGSDRPAATQRETAQAGKVPQVTSEQPMSFWMAKKLDLSKSILESLTKGDFDELAKDAGQLRLLGKIEAFVRRKNPDYRAQVRTFDFANQELVRQAQRRNAEGATLAFNQLTTSCVACHILLREGAD